MTDGNQAAEHERNATLRLYASIMEEIKLRHAAIDTGLGTARALLPAPLTSEFCFLQIRMICELIAIGCLVAHGDITKDGKGKRLLNEWSAETIMTELGKLHPYFFPRPIKLTVTERNGANPKGSIHLASRGRQISKEEFLTLYGRAGGALHRGTLNKLIGRKPTKAPGDAEIKDWAQKLMGLLNDHHISSWDNLRQLVCIMKATDQGGRVSVFLGEAPPETSIDVAQALFSERG